MDNFIYQAITSIGYPGIFLLMIIFPSETVMIAAGYTASNSDFSLWLAIVAGALGSTFGSCLIYALARSADQKTMYALFDRWGRFIGLNHKSAVRAGKWFNKHAKTTVFFGRFVPAMRTAVSIPAGFERMSFKTFAFFTLLGSGINAGLLATLGYVSGNNIDAVTNAAATSASYISIALVIVFVAIVYLRLRHR